MYISPRHFVVVFIEPQKVWVGIIYTSPSLVCPHSRGVGGRAPTRVPRAGAVQAVSPLRNPDRQDIYSEEFLDLSTGCHYSTPGFITWTSAHTISHPEYIRGTRERKRSYLIKCCL